MPAATGRTLSRVKAPTLRSGTRADSSIAAFSTRLSLASPQACASGPVVLRLSSAPGRKRQAIGAIGERHHAFEIVITVDAATDHAQAQIDLGASLFTQHRRDAPTRAQVS